MIWDLAQQKALASLATKKDKKPLEGYLTQLICIYVVKACLSLSLTEWEDFKIYCNFSTVIKAVKASNALDSPKIRLGGGLCFSGSTGWPNRIFWIRQDHEARIWNVLWWGKCYPKRSVIACKLLIRYLIMILDDLHWSCCWRTNKW